MKAEPAQRGVELRLASVRHKLPRLWDRAAWALATGQEHLAGLALRRRQVLLRELESLSRVISLKAPDDRVGSRIEAADRLLDASLCETSRTTQPQPREPVVLDLDPAVQSDLRKLRAQVGNGTWRGPKQSFRKGGA